MKSLCALIVGFVALAGTVLAQGRAEVALEARSIEALDAGQRTRVIVQFELPQIAFDGATREDQDLARIDSIHGLTRTILERNFGASAQALSQPSESRPQVATTYDYTPAITMVLNQAEIDALATDPDVTRIVTDGLDRPMLDESVPQMGANILHGAGIVGAGTTIAILDTGIAFDSPAFSGRILDSACFSTTDTVNGSFSVCPNGENIDIVSERAGDACHQSVAGLGCYHGTHVASIAAGAPGEHPSFGRYNYTGTAPSSNLVSIQVFSSFSDANFCGGSGCIQSYISDQIRALEWLYENHSRLNLTVINMSLGGATHSNACNADPRATIIGSLFSVGIPTVVSAGNEGLANEVSAPGCISSAIAIGNVDRFLSPSGNRGELVDFVAPGSEVTAANDPAYGTLTRTLSGTSMSAAHFTGAFALLAGQYSHRSTSTILAAMADRGTPVLITTGRTRPFVRVDLANFQLSGVGTGAIGIIEPTNPIIAGHVPDPNSFNSLRYTLINNSAFDADWDLRNFDKNLNFSAIGHQPVSYDTHNSIGGTLSPGASIDVNVHMQGSITQYTDVTSGFTLVHGNNPREFDISIVYSYPAPRNDNVENALDLSTQTGFSISPTFGPATYQTGELALAGWRGSVWYRFEAGSTGEAALTTSYKDPDFGFPFSQMSPTYIFRLENGTRVPIADSFNNVIDGRIVFPIVAENEYLFQIHVPNAAKNEFTITNVFTRTDGGPQTSELFRPFTLRNAGRAIMNTNIATVGPRNSHDPTEGPQPALRTWSTWTAPLTGRLVITNLESRDAQSISVYRRRDGSATHSESDPASLMDWIESVSFTPAEAIGATLEIDVERGVTYWIEVGASTDRLRYTFAYGMAALDQNQLRAAVLPNVRNGLIGQPLTAFMTVINPASASGPATDCRIETRGGSGNGDGYVAFSYRQTDMSNTAMGNSNPLFNLSPGESKSFVLIFSSPTQNALEYYFNFYCDQVIPSSLEPEIAADDFYFRTSFDPLEDIISIAATSSNDGIIDVSNNRYSAFSVAAVNAGLGQGDIEVRASISSDEFTDTASALVEVCETNPIDGICISERSEFFQTQFDSGEVRTFSVFVRADAMPASFSPGRQRINVQFTSVNGYKPAGRTSVAWRALGD